MFVVQFLIRVFSSVYVTLTVIYFCQGQKICGVKISKKKTLATYVHVYIAYIELRLYKSQGRRS